LRFAPHLEAILNQLIEVLSPNQIGSDIETVEDGISQLMECLRSSRCLIVLDDFDAILGNDSHDDPHHNLNDFELLLPQIQYRPGYEGYGELIRRVGESQHQSCLLLTSREKPQEIAALEGGTLPVRSLKLNGLSPTQSLLILDSKGFVNYTEEESRILVEWYAGNPLFLKLVATAIKELFGGNIYEFIEQGTVVFGDIRSILDQQFNRLSWLEKQVMYWLTLNPNFVSLRKLQKEIIPRVSQRFILEAIELLQRRSLIERQASSFSQSPVWMEYIAERLIEENFKLGEHRTGSLLMSHTIFEAQLKNYIREIRINAQI
jgi:hypothetical protein